MKKILSLVLAMMMFMALLPAASAAEVIGSGWCGENLKWTLDEGGTLTVSGTGEMEDYDRSYPTPWKDDEKKIKTVIIEDGVTKVGVWAFEGCYNLTSVSMADSVKNIDIGAFGSCEKLTDVRMPKALESIGDYAFQFCIALTEIDIPEKVTSIGEGAFEDCTALTGIEIPEGVTSIGNAAFYECYELRTISMPKSVTSIGGSAFNETAYYYDEKNWENGALYIGSVLAKAKGEEIKGGYAVKDGTTAVSDYAFINCGDLSKITIPASVKEIGDSAFANCESLIRVSILGEAVKIGENAFKKCKELNDIEISGGAAEVGRDAFVNTAYYENENNWENGVLYVENILAAARSEEVSGEYVIKEGTTSVSNGAFYGCGELTGVTMPKSMAYIGKDAFKNCVGLTEINVESGCENYESRDGVLFGKGLTSLMKCPEGKVGSFSIPTGTVKIEEGAFSGCKSLKNVTIPKGMKEIGREAFGSCTELENVTIPESVESVGLGAFWYCESIESIVIPKKVKSVEDDLFFGCKSLESVTIPEGTKRIGAFAFAECGKLKKIMIPGGVVEIGHDAFVGCKSLESVVLKKGLVSIGDRAFEKCGSLKSVTIPEGVEEIRDSAFHACSSLTDITIPEGVKVIGEHAFSGCDLKEITIPKGAKIKSSAFFYCQNLKKVSLPEGMESIPDRTFEGCKSLTDITIPESVREIGREAFFGCESLKDIRFPDGLTTVDGNAFWNTAYFNDEKNIDGGVLYIGDILVRAKTDEVSGVYKIRDGVTNISARAFEGCMDMTGAVIPESVTRIGENAFWGSGYYLDEKNWDNDALYIGDILISIRGDARSGHYRVKDGTGMIAEQAFFWGDSLTAVSIPKSVKSIGKWAFLDAYELTSVYYEGTEEEWKELEADDIFGNINKPRIYYNCDFDGINVYLDGEKVEFDQEPVILEGRTLVPVRAVVEAMGGTAEWDDASKTATLRFDGHEIKLTAGSTEASLDGEMKTLDKAPEIIGERMLIPIRFVAESFGFEVYWNDEIKSVIIEGC